MENLNIWIPGDPPRTTHQSGIRFTKYGKTFKSKELKAVERDLKAKLMLFAPADPIEGPILLMVTWGFFTKSKKKWMTYKTTRPDTDNMMKTLKDVMTGCGFWKDDAQIVVEVGKKLWVDKPGTVITIERLGGTVEDWRGQDDLRSA